MDKSKEAEEGNRKAKRIQSQSEQLKGGGGGAQGKSCKGYLYYSSTLKSNGINPRCIGIPRTLPQVPSYVVGQSEAEASREGRALLDFYYACAGYSVYVNKDHSSDKGVTKRELPVCLGLELLVDRRVNSQTSSAPADAYSREDGRELQSPHPRTHKPAHTLGDDFLDRQANS
uniref:Uncharacterized protein LOC105128642 n=1 Tax=Rhizophora mucronata TaxID=61149 RepID=A0A2P2JU86_RHIMU